MKKRILNTVILSLTLGMVSQGTVQAMDNNHMAIVSPQAMLAVGGLCFITVGATLYCAPSGDVEQAVYETYHWLRHSNQLNAITKTIDPIKLAGLILVGIGGNALYLAYRTYPRATQNAIQRQQNAHTAWEAGAPARMAAIQAAQHDVDDENDNDPNAIQCSVCLSNIKANEPKTSLPCQHAFHRNCLGQWLTQIAHNPMAKNCPMCRDNK